MKNSLSNKFESSNKLSHIRELYQVVISCPLEYLYFERGKAEDRRQKAEGNIDLKIKSFCLLAHNYVNASAERSSIVNYPDII